MVKIKGAEESGPGIAQARVRRIMKSTADAGHITGDALCLMTKAAEQFVQYLAKQAYKRTEGKNSTLLTYQSLAETVSEDESLDFLHQIIPKKITVKKYKELLAEAKEEDREDREDRESSDSEEEQKDETEQKKSPKK